MNKKDRAKEYADAIFSIAEEENSKDEYLAALEKIDEAFSKNPEYVLFLSSPNISKSERIGALEKAFSSCVPRYVLYFLQLLCEKEYIQNFYKCEEEYKKLYNASKMVSTAKVRSAVPLTEEEKVRLAEKLRNISGNFVVLECSTDKTLLGGVIVEIDGKIIDGSLRRRLHEVKEVMNT